MRGDGVLRRARQSGGNMSNELRPTLRFYRQYLPEALAGRYLRGIR
jgi:hypothetical protein